MRPRRAAPLVAAIGIALAASLTGCTPALPPSVVPGTTVTVGWSGGLTSMNPLADATAANLEVAAATRSGFGRIVDGEFVSDPSFGTVSITGDDPFTVTYDLAEPAWSDGIPLDAADLLLGWAFHAGLLGDDQEEGAVLPVPSIDEFSRSIAVAFPEPSIEWRTAVGADVPAHIVGKRAFGLDDPMQAKQSVIQAIRTRDPQGLADIARAWKDGFALDDDRAPSDALISSGPYRVSEITSDDSGQRVTLVPNEMYRGTPTGQVARVDLVPAGADAAASIGDALDIAQVAPTAQNAPVIGELERRDATVITTHTGHVWAVELAPVGVFATPAARSAFLRAVPVNDMVDAAAGPWSSAYTKTTALTAAPGTRAYDIVSADSGFTAALGTPTDDAAIDRAAAGVATGAPVCVLYDRASAFAVAAFGVLRDALTTAGWAVSDCGSGDIEAARHAGGWTAVIDRVAVPETVAGLAAQWGSASADASTRLADADRDALIAQYAQTVDVYEAREVLAQIEASIVRAAVARPLAVDPLVTVAGRTVTGVTTHGGAAASITAGIAQWAVVP